MAAMRAWTAASPSICECRIGARVRHLSASHRGVALLVAASLPCYSGGVGEQDDRGFRVDVERLASGAIEVTPVGEVDLDTAPELVRVTQDALKHEPADVRVRLDRVTFMDSTGTMALLDLREAARERRRSFRLVNPTRTVVLVLELSGLSEELEVEGGDEPG
jgi:anti-sigma B factor antagonist